MKVICPNCKHSDKLISNFIVRIEQGFGKRPMLRAEMIAYEQKVGVKLKHKVLLKPYIWTRILLRCPECKHEHTVEWRDEQNKE
jgi:phage FluMu protein Com